MKQCDKKKEKKENTAGVIKRVKQIKEKKRRKKAKKRCSFLFSSEFSFSCVFRRQPSGGKGELCDVIFLSFRPFLISETG